MRRQFFAQPVLRAATIALVVAGLAACGVKGPLRPPPKSAPASNSTAPSANPPTPPPTTSPALPPPTSGAK
ncbi:MAG TPA: lipoprotein [Casimicrobiaceae bacterium]|nr:lipoprotein [Casimicrobiaceae bacterium]